jgi:serine/threonine protein phosphatase PrpC
MGYVPGSSSHTSVSGANETSRQLWDVTDDQTAVDLIRKVEDAQEASRVLLDYAITNYSTDNLSVMVVRFK